MNVWYYWLAALLPLCLGCSKPGVERPSATAVMPTEAGTFSKMPPLK